MVSIKPDSAEAELHQRLDSKGSGIKINYISIPYKIDEWLIAIDLTDFALSVVLGHQCHDPWNFSGGL